MTKSKKPVKKIKRVKKVKETLTEVIAEPEVVQPQEPVTHKDSWFTKILKYGLGPAIVTGLLALAPQLIDKAVAFYHNMSYEDYILAQKQLKYWHEHADCINKDAFTISNSSAEIKLRMCDTALVMAEFQGKNGKGFTWIDLNIKELQQSASVSFADSLIAQPQQRQRLNQNNDTWKFQRQQEKLMCKAETENEILYYIKKSDGKCELKKINKITSSVSSETIDCQKICKN
jgi:hypothetical protein